jgi:hypothetical protein
MEAFGEEADLKEVGNADILKAAGLQEKYSVPVKLKDSHGETSYTLSVVYEVR